MGEENVYEGCKISRVYKSKKDNRLRIMVTFPNKKRKVMSYPKYLVEKHINRYLDKDETVDHIDNNYLNNELSNLRVLTRSEHGKQDRLKPMDVILNCVWCGTEFKVEGNKIRYMNRQSKANGFCSRTCSGKYGASKRYTGKKISGVNIERKYYREKEKIKMKSVL